jgi:hypothetical protein
MCKIEQIPIGGWRYFLPTMGNDQRNDLQRDPTVLWRSGPVTCVVCHHERDPQIEIRVLVDGGAIHRQFFDDYETASNYAVKMTSLAEALTPVQHRA